MMSFVAAQSWHDGEEQMHSRMRVPAHDNPTVPGLSQQLAYGLQTFPLLAVGTVDDEKRPWVTIWGGRPGLARPIGGGMIGIRTSVESAFDPVVKALTSQTKGDDGGGVSVTKEGEKGRMMAALTLDLVKRKRVKLAGRVVAAALDVQKVETESESSGQSEKMSERSDDVESEVQLVVRIEESLGNCPKYLNQKTIEPARPSPSVVQHSASLSADAMDLISQADMFFMSSRNGEVSMDVNHRGGPPGFVRMLPNPDSRPSATLVYPEYSGNRLYQTLGNLINSPQVGLVFPDFSTGNVLYITGSTKILVGKDAAASLPRSNLAVQVEVQDAIFVKQGLPFRGTPVEDGYSPYNPTVRKATGEKGASSRTETDRGKTATLIGKKDITPTISRYTFRLNDTSKTKPSWKAGQYVALDFSEELDVGYSHMRDDDPTSLNDDFIRTFTVSSPPKDVGNNLGVDFELTVRSTGRNVTKFLKTQKINNGLEVGFKGFGGDFTVEPPLEGERVTFIAGGIGITPLMAALDSLDPARLNLLWIIKAADVDIVCDFVKTAGVAVSTTVFMTGDLNDAGVAKMEILKNMNLTLNRRRPEASDITGLTEQTTRWYLCSGRALRDQVLEWLPEKDVIYESFDY